MNQEDMSEIMQKISSMLSQQTQENTPHNEDISFSSEENSSASQQKLFSPMNSQSSEKQENNNFQFDIETIMKIKSIMDSLQSTKNNPEANLLIALKPYLNNNRKQKLDQYIQFLNISKILDAWNNSNGGVKQ